MSYRPITDTWILARSKLAGGRKYYGAYPGGFPERARALLGVSLSQPVLHVCGGMARHYPYAGGFGPLDRTLDLDPETEPDYCQDAREALPGLRCWHCDAWAKSESSCTFCHHCHGSRRLRYWPAILIDPPYTEADAEHYRPGKGVFPSANLLLKNAVEAVAPGGRVGMLHYLLPSPPRAWPCRFVAAVSVITGFNNRVRLYSVFERLPEVEP